jgi:hypothetical protein
MQKWLNALVSFLIHSAGINHPTLIKHAENGRKIQKFSELFLI